MVGQHDTLSPSTRWTRDAGHRVLRFAALVLKMESMSTVPCPDHLPPCRAPYPDACLYRVVVSTPIGYVGTVINISPEGGKVKLRFGARESGWFDVEDVRPRSRQQAHRNEPIPEYADPYPDASLNATVVARNSSVLGRVLRIGPGGEMVELGLPIAESQTQRKSRLKSSSSIPTHPYRGWFYLEGLRALTSEEVAEWEVATEQRV